MMPTNFDIFQLVLVFVSVIGGVIAAVYFYLSTDIFMNLLKRPLRFISSGMVIMTIGVMMAAVVSYEARLGVVFTFYGMPIEIAFYVAYIIGSLLILVGARQFVRKPKPLMVE